MAAKSSDVDFRRTWNKEEYSERAKKRDADEAERMKENEERIKQGKQYRAILGILCLLNRSIGKRPRKGGLKEAGPKPTELMKARETSLELDKNLNKTMVVTNPGGRGAGQPGFFCEACNRNYRDTTGYLDHINSRARTYLSVSGSITLTDTQ